MKVLLINGSPHLEGNTKIALDEMVKIFDEQKIDSEIINVGNQDIRGCIACGYCYKHGKCAFNDIVNETLDKFKEADALVVATPVYYAGINGTLKSFLDRLFYSKNFDTTMKVGAAVTIARRGGQVTSYDTINKYFGISNMPIATSQYWNMVYGRQVGEVNQDTEGMQTMRALARNISFLVKSIALGKKEYGLPEKEEWKPMHFIR